MDEKQAKQLEIVKSVFKEHKNSLVNIREEILDIGRLLMKDVNAFEVVSGKSELVLATSALLSLAQQLDMIIPDNDAE